MSWLGPMSAERQQTESFGAAGFARAFAVIVLALFASKFGVEALAQDARYHIPPVETHLIESRFNNQTYVIRVQVPASRRGEAERFPVLYLTDVNGQLDGSFIQWLQLSGEVERFITVGIGYPVDNIAQSMALRGRDLTPTVVDGLSDYHQIPLEGVVPVEAAEASGGAPAFLQFIEEQLIPFVDGKYHTIPGENSFSGHSLGGVFGLYVLFHHPQAFDNFIIGSPSIWWDDEIALEWARKYAQSGEPLDARVYLAVGGREEVVSGAAVKMTSNVYSLEAILANAAIAGLDLKTEVFPEEEHMSVFPMIQSRGLRYIYRRGCSLFIPNGCDERDPGRPGRHDP